MKAQGGMEFEYLFLKDANLKPCTGCYACIAKGEDNCPLKDDRAALEHKLLAADGVILSSPMHVLNVSALIMNFIDRFAYANHRPRFFKQKVLPVVNMGGDSPKTALKLLRHALGGSRVVRELGITPPPWPQKEHAVAKKERALDEAAGEFYRACLDTSLPSPTLRDLVIFLFRQKAVLECRKYLPADYAYYNGKIYYYETKINPVKAALAKAIVKVMINRMKDKGPGSIAWPGGKEEES